MALDTQIAHAAANAAANALLALANGGTMKLYNGAKPASANVAVSSQTMLSSHGLSATAFQAAVNGVAAANPIGNAAAAATGTATWFRVFTSGGAAVFDGTVGTSGCNLNLNSVDIQINATVAIAGYSFSVLEAGQ